MQHRNDNILLFIAIGDAVAAATEYVKTHEYPRLIENVLRLDDYYQHPRHHDLKPGMYTDDTQMSIGVADVLMELPNNGDSFRTETLARCFANGWTRTFHRDPRAGYAREFQKFLASTKTGDEFMRNIRPVSNKNGACMRAVPIGVVSSTSVLCDIAAGQARTTHDTEIGIFSAHAVALMSHFALYHDESFKDLQSFLEIHFTSEQMRYLNINLSHRWRGPVKNPATNTVHAVFDLLTHCSTLSEVLRGAIQFGGDTDSVAAIALGIASARMPNDLPQVLFDKLENGTYGRDYLATLGKQLMDAYA